MRPHHLPRRQLIRTVPRLEINSLLVVFQRLLDGLEERVGLVLVDTDVVADGEDDFADLLLLAVFVVLLVLVERDGDVDAGFGGPGGVHGEPVWGVLVELRPESRSRRESRLTKEFREVCLQNLLIHGVWNRRETNAHGRSAWGWGINDIALPVSAQQVA